MKVILVTGSSSGIGNYISRQYANNKEYQVIGLDINQPEPLTNLEFIPVDLTSEEACNVVFTKIPKIDLAINCAGVSPARKLLTEHSSVEVANAWHSNFIPCFNALRSQLQIMSKQGVGKIINIASITAHVGKKRRLAYSIAKASIVNMTQVAAIEHAPYIQINSISPATIDTPMIRNKNKGILPDYTNIYHTPTCGSVADVYNVVKMLEFDNFMTGNDIKLDGGMSTLFNDTIN